MSCNLHDAVAVLERAPAVFRALLTGAPDVSTFLYGERQYSAVDPGDTWTFSQTVEDVDPASWGGVLTAEPADGH